MTTATAPLRHEHRELLPHVDRLRKIAADTEHVSLDALRAEIDEAYDFLAHHLIPHAKAEEEALYPVVARVLGSPKATATMSRDHIEVMHFVDELSNLRAQLHGQSPQHLAVDLRRVLYGLHAIVKLHFAKEEEVYLPLLDERLTMGEAADMFDRMEQAAAQAKLAH